jgi:hypothetical protein
MLKLDEGVDMKTVSDGNLAEKSNLFLIAGAKFCLA